MTEQYTLSYPRKTLLRGTMRVVGRSFMALLTRTTISGKHHLPQNGPLILVGNHVAMLEVVMMALYVPWLVEIIGAGDIPLDPRFAPFINAYGMIPINRGSMDREGLNMALDVLKQDGVVGIFPEGGIWDTTLRQGRTGVSWLSYKAGAPIIPIGFGGVEGALTAALKLKRPRLSMNIGEVIPPITVDGKSRKQALEDGAQLVMERIDALIPEEDKLKRFDISDEHFDFVLEIHDQDGQAAALPDHLKLNHPEELGQFFHRPVLLDTMARNLHLPVQALRSSDIKQDPVAVASALEAVLDYLRDNPYFLTYRFGYDVGGAMKDGITELYEAAKWAAQAGCLIHLSPIRRYHTASGEEVVEVGLHKAHNL